MEQLESRRSTDTLDPAGAPSFSVIIQDSIYDLSFALPICHQLLKDNGRRTAMGQVLLLLLMNAILQGIVVVKVLTVSSRMYASMTTEIGAVCEDLNIVNDAGLSFPRLLNETPADGAYHDCGPLSITLMLNASQVDLDGDGWWTADEASRHQKLLEDKFRPRVADVVEVHAALLNMYHEGRLQKQQSLSMAHPLPQTASGPDGIPTAWLADADGEQPLLRLCSTTSAEVCPNLEGRDILKGLFPQYANTTFGAHLRIKKCLSVIGDYCPEVFGERFGFYVEHKSMLCGEPAVGWDEELRARRVIFSESFTFVSSHESVVSVPYAMFLFVMLSIWLASMFRELRDVFTWWYVFIRFPASATVDSAVRYGKSQVEIQGITSCHRCLMLLANVIPRCGLSLALTLAGLIVLLFSNGYAELISNGVALEFLSEVDAMLFYALVSEHDKDLISRVKPIVVKAPSRAKRVDNAEGFSFWALVSNGPMQTLIYASLIFLVAGAVQTWEYLAPQGKIWFGHRLMCFCQVGGTSCLGAQALGGLSKLKRIEYMSLFMGGFG